SYSFKIDSTQNARTLVVACDARGQHLRLSSSCTHLANDIHRNSKNENGPQKIPWLRGAFPARAVSSRWPASRLHNQQTNLVGTATSPRKMGGSHGGPREGRQNH